jgi:hypothetical protein
MKHLTLFLALVLGTSSFAQYITVSSVVYDSLEVYFGNEHHTAVVSMQSNGLYTANVNFRWSPDFEEVANGGGYVVPPLVTINPSVFSRTDIYTLFPQAYQELAGERGGIYFQIRYDVVDDAGNIMQTYVSPVRTWRFEAEISTAVSDQDASPVVSIYPNPTQDRFQIEGYSGPVQVTNALGQVVLSTWLGQGETADVSALPSGTYIILAGQTFLGRLQKL